jgi:hypothetical protein
MQQLASLEHGVGNKFAGFVVLSVGMNGKGLDK